MNADGSIGCAWTAGDHQHRGFAAELCVSVGHESCTAFLPANDKTDVLVPVQAVKHRQIAFARNAENRVNALDSEGVGDQMTAQSRLRGGKSFGRMV